MTTVGTIGSVTLAAVLLGGCAVSFLSADQRARACVFAIDDQSGHPAVRPNPYANPAGALAGAGTGAALGMQAGYLAVFTLPIGIAIGAAGGAACAAASLSHPQANQQFAALVEAADLGTLKHALEADLGAPRAECGRIPSGGFSTPAPDAVVVIEGLEARMGCAFGQQEYRIAVDWRTIDTRTRRAINSTRTACEQTSFRTVDAWLADPAAARAEIERVLALVGHRMAAQLLSPAPLPLVCRLRSDAHGAVAPW